MLHLQALFQEHSGACSINYSQHVNTYNLLKAKLNRVTGRLSLTGTQQLTCQIAESQFILHSSTYE